MTNTRTEAVERLATRLGATTAIDTGYLPMQVRDDCHEAATLLLDIVKERDEARAQLAGAFEKAARWLVAAGMAGDAPEDPLASCIRALTPADAQVALNAMLERAWNDGFDYRAAGRARQDNPFTSLLKHADREGGV